MERAKNIQLDRLLTAADGTVHWAARRDVIEDSLDEGGTADNTVQRTQWTIRHSSLPHFLIETPEFIDDEGTSWRIVGNAEVTRRQFWIVTAEFLT